jgi:purine-binding chemotaxis protein CheW
VSTTSSELPGTTLEAGQLVIFTLQGERYALPIGNVQEIIRYTEPRTIETGVPWVRGVISLRGKIIPICDLASRLGQPGNHADEAKIVIVDTDNGTAGVIVDEVNEVITAAADQYDTAAGRDNDYIDAIVKIDGWLVVLLNPQLLLGD